MDNGLNTIEEAEDVVAEEDYNTRNKTSHTYNTMLANITNHSTRPDLFLAEVEKIDPGFLKKMNEISLKHADEDQKALYKFVKIQSYTILSIRVLSIFLIFGVLFFAIYKEANVFFAFMGAAGFYAVAQSGGKGFMAIAHAIGELIKNLKSKQ